MSINRVNFLKKVIHNADYWEIDEDYFINKCEYSDDGEILEVEGSAMRISTFPRPKGILVVEYRECFKWRKGHDQKIFEKHLESSVFGNDKFMGKRAREIFYINTCDLDFAPKHFITIDYDQFDHEDLKYLGV